MAPRWNFAFSTINIRSESNDGSGQNDEKKHEVVGKANYNIHQNYMKRKNGLNRGVVEHGRERAGYYALAKTWSCADGGFWPVIMK